MGEVVEVGENEVRGDENQKWDCESVGLSGSNRVHGARNLGLGFVIRSRYRVRFGSTRLVIMKSVL